MKPFKDEMKARGWWSRPNSQMPATHLFLDGGKLTVPDDHAGTLLNLYFNAIIRGEKISLVETKSPVFRLFFDIDARVSEPTDFDFLFQEIYSAVRDFWVLHDTVKMIVCAAPEKTFETDQTYGAHTKYGFHIFFPHIYVNAPIALAFRDSLIERLEAADIPACLNAWADVLDQAVFKGSGLRLVYSSKGPGEDRAYVPLLVVEQASLARISNSLTSMEKRVFVHDCSIRTTELCLTPCAGGQDAIADHPTVHKEQGHVIGTSVSLEAYMDVLPKIKTVLPAEYERSRFVSAFKTEHAVMLRSSSRYCQNVGREHRTSTVYFCVTRRGVCQKCYCRKDDHGCAQYSSDYYPLDDDILDVFVPRTCHVVPEEDSLIGRKMPSKKTSTTSLGSLLDRSRFLKTTQSKKCKKK